MEAETIRMQKIYLNWQFFFNIILVGIIMLVTLAHSQAAEPFHGFNLNSEAINPVCINKMRPGLSDQGIIVKSIILENCQNSNWGFHSKPINIKGNEISTELEEGEVFSYEVIGKTDSGLFIVFHTGYIAAYSIEEQIIKKDLLKPETEKIHVLTIIGDSFVPCFMRAKLKGNILIIDKHVFNLEASNAEQCKDEMETFKYQIGN